MDAARFGAPRTLESDMKLLLVAAVAALLVAAPASAQTTPAPAAEAVSSCAELAPPPRLPDGATAPFDAMQVGDAAFRAWAESNRAILACRLAEVEAAHARWQALRQAYNSGAEQLAAVNAAWEADVTEFNERR
jgi:hypothetical protein